MSSPNKLPRPPGLARLQRTSSRRPNACKVDVDGATLWDRVFDAKHRKHMLGEKIRIGKNFYDQLRVQFESVESIDRQLVCPEDCTESDALLKSLVQSFKQPPARVPLRSWCEQQSSINMADAIA
eukprot:6162129-Amphidinium_carterae.1